MIDDYRENIKRIRNIKKQYRQLYFAFKINSFLTTRIINKLKADTEWDAFRERFKLSKKYMNIMANLMMEHNRYLIKYNTNYMDYLKEVMAVNKEIVE